MYILTAHGEVTTMLRVSHDIEKLKAFVPEAKWTKNGPEVFSQTFYKDHGPWKEETWYVICEIKEV